MREDALPAFYLRLSVADGDKKESDSIENQRKLLLRYIGKMPEFGGSDIMEVPDVPHLEYIDDGYSGKNFNRPAFRRLITDCRKGKVSAILVKDVSRLGRDYVEVNSYLEDIFPFLRVRFIDATLKYDTGTECQSELPFDVQFSNMVNTYYLKDIAIKSAAGRVAKWKRGELASTSTPIGYVCKDVKTGWSIDEDGADIVRTVFDLALTGLGTGAIATEMNRRGIPTPYRYLKSKGLWRGGSFNTVEEKMVWDYAVVANILRNEAYTGMLVQGKTQSIVLGKGISKPAPDNMRWKHEGKHEAIVSPEEFEKAKSVIRFLDSPVERTEHDYTLKSVVRCKNCGRRMIRSMSGTFSCHGKHQKDFTGCGGTWKEEEIEKVVLEELIRRGKQAAELLRSLKRDDYDVSGAKKEIADLKRELTSKYMAYVRKEISQEDYIAFQKEVRAKTAELEGRITVTRGSNEHLEEVEDALKPLADGSVAAEKNGLTQAMVQELVENVWVGDEITVEFKADSIMQIAEDELMR